MHNKIKSVKPGWLKQLAADKDIQLFAAGSSLQEFLMQGRQRQTTIRSENHEKNDNDHIRINFKVLNSSNIS